jgi:uncharacterized protein
MRRVPWSAGSWTHPPASVLEEGDDLVVTAVAGSDAWRVTSYGFVHDDEHALLTPFPTEGTLEVTFTADLAQQFDQAGLFLRISDEHWIKAGVEFADGQPQVGAVVTRGSSDWSVAPVPEWQDRRVTIRASWADDAITLRARRDDEPWRLVRVVPFAVPTALAGPMLGAPSRAGLTVRFHSWTLLEKDEGLHP